MKKVLSVLCMALLAGGMIFTSCTKNFTITVKSNNDAWGTVAGGGSYADGATATLTASPKDGYMFVKWNDGDKTNPRTITVNADAEYTAFFEAIPVTPGVKVTFNGNSWTAGDYAGNFYSGTMQDGSSYSGWIVSAAQTAGSDYPTCDLATLTGKNTGSFNDQANSSNGGLTGGDFNYIEYYNETTLTDGTYNYGDWWAKTATLNITAFDATAMTLSSNLTATMFDAYNAFVDQAGVDAAPTAPMTDVITNVTLSQTKGVALKNGAKKQLVAVR